jgi:hypothetical protein
MRRFFVPRMLNRLPPFSVIPERLDGGWQYRERNMRVLMPAIPIAIATAITAVAMLQYAVPVAAMFATISLFAVVAAIRLKGRVLHISDDGRAVLDTYHIHRHRRVELPESWTVWCVPFETTRFEFALPWRGWCVVVLDGEIAFPVIIDNNREYVEGELSRLPPPLSSRLLLPEAEIATRL